MPGIPPTSKKDHSPFLSLLLSWYFMRRPLAVLQSYKTYALVFAESFSFIFLLRTLFAPWKNITDRYPKRGFDLNLMLQAWMFNIITRAIGCIMRLGAILCGIVVQCALLLGFLGYLVLWLLFPILFLLGILSLLHFL